MKIKEIIKNKKPLISFEIFPPKKDSIYIDSIYATIDQLVALNPDFISVTYGAGGTTKDETVSIASYVKSKGCEPLAHLTCISSTKEEIKYMCNELKKNGIENIMALRGDKPIETNPRFKSQFKYASELNDFIKNECDIDFCLGGACYPEGHSENTFEDDLQNLKKKVDAGAEFLVSQIFFDNAYFYNLVSEARRIGINVPIFAGIMPVVNKRQIEKMASIGRVTIPKGLKQMMDKFSSSKKAMREVGVSFATSQIIDLLAKNVDGIHIYTMNNILVSKGIYDNIPNIIKAVVKND